MKTFSSNFFAHIKNFNTFAEYHKPINPNNMKETIKKIRQHLEAASAATQVKALNLILISPQATIKHVKEQGMDYLDAYTEGMDVEDLACTYPDMDEQVARDLYLRMTEEEKEMIIASDRERLDAEVEYMKSSQRFRKRDDEERWVDPEMVIVTIYDNGLIRKVSITKTAAERMRKLNAMYPERYEENEMDLLSDTFSKWGIEQTANKQL